MIERKGLSYCETARRFEVKSGGICHRHRRDAEVQQPHGDRSMTQIAILILDEENKFLEWLEFINYIVVLAALGCYATFANSVFNML